MATIVAITSQSVAYAGPDPLTSLTREVTKVRGLRAKKKLVHEIVDRAQLRERLRGLAADDKTKQGAVAEGLALARWGFIPVATDYVKLRLDLLTDQVAGYYDPKTKTLTITKDPAGDAKWTELVLAHEIDHALQDQTFDLQKLTDLPDGEADAVRARQAVIEGDGVALMIELALSRQKIAPPWDTPGVATDVVRAMTGPTHDALDQAPLAIREWMLFAYRDGFGFVATLLRQGGWSAVNKALRTPPRSTEQILHPEKYTSDEKPIAVKLAPPESLGAYTVAHSTVWGELGFSLFLRSHGIPDDVAALAAAGWGGDRVLVLARANDPDPTHAIGLARLEFDAEADAIEAYAAASRALDAAQAGVTAEQTDTRIRWLGIDGKVTTLERTGTVIDILLGVPVYANK